MSAALVPCADLSFISFFFSALLLLLASPDLASEPPLAADEASFLPAAEAPVPMVEDALDPLSDFVADDAPVPMVDEDSPCLADEPPAPMDEELDCA